MSDLNALMDAVEDERTFVAFLLALAEDRRKNADYRWQWDSIEDFLEASAAWAADTKTAINGYTPPDNAWKRCADIIFAGKIYE